MTGKTIKQDQHQRVFMVVDGRLVRKPGDLRDPNRRYAAATDSEGGYHREFTDEEERQRDEEEARWLAEAPQREAEEKRREEDSARFRESLKYEPRIVAFLDILGWASAIDASEHSIELTQKLGITMQGLVAHVDMVSWQRGHAGSQNWPGDPMMTHFSDSLLISFSADDHGKRNLESTLFSIIQSLMLQGFVVRGAVSYGPLIHRESLAYGPALIAAYELEKNEAIAPRIILDRSLANAWGRGVPVQDINGTLLGSIKFWRQDDDGWYFFDHLSNPYGHFNLNREEPSFIFQENMNRWRELIVQRMAENQDRSAVLRKYVWLARYFNRISAENSNSQIETISLPSD